MAGSVNKVILIGRVGKDPEVRTFSNGGKVCNLSLATSERWKDKATGERKERTEWHRIAIFNEHLVKIAESYIKKGSLIHIEGQLETRKYEKDGEDRYTTEIVLRPYAGEITLLEAKKGSGDDSATDDGTDTGSGSSAKSTASSGRGDMDDEIPF